MNRRALILAALLAGLPAGCGFVAYVFRYRFKVVLRDGAGLHTGSSVISVSFGDTRGGCCGSEFPVRIIGEAPAVDLGGKGYAFALLNRLIFGPNADDLAIDRRYAASLPIDVIGQKFPAEYQAGMMNNDDFPTLLRLVMGSREEVAVSPSKYPTLASFKNLNDPSTVSLISQDASSADILIEHCSVQITDAPASHAINNILPWLPRWKTRGSARQLDGQVGFRQDRANTPNLLTNEFFSRE